MLNATPNNSLGEFQLFTNQGPARLSSLSRDVRRATTEGNFSEMDRAYQQYSAELDGQLKALGRYIAAIAEAEKDKGGDHDYDGALQVVWAGLHEQLGEAGTTCHLETTQFSDRQCSLDSDITRTRTTRSGYVRKNIGSSMRLRVFKKDGYRCITCGTSEDLSIDHIHPVSRGGSNDPENLQTMCLPCNMSKGAKVAS